MKKILLFFFFISIFFSCKENTYPSTEIPLISKQEIATGLSIQVSLNNVFHLFEQVIKPILNSESYKFTCPTIRKVFVLGSVSSIDSLIVSFDSSTCEKSRLKGSLRIKILEANKYKIDCYDFKSSVLNMSGSIYVDYSKDGISGFQSDKLLFVDQTNPNVLVKFSTDYEFISTKNKINSFSLKGDYSFYEGFSDIYELNIIDESVLVKSDCGYIYSGKAVLSIGSGTVLNIDYIDDTCAGEIILSIDDFEENLKF